MKNKRLFLWCGGMSGKNHYCKSPRKKFFLPIHSLRIHWLCNFAHFCCCCCGRVFIFIHFFSPIIPNTAEKCRRLLETKPFLCCKNEVTREDSKKWQRTEKNFSLPFSSTFSAISVTFISIRVSLKSGKTVAVCCKKKRRVVKNSMNQKCRLHAPTMATEEQKKMRNQIWFTSSDQHRGEEGVTKRR